MCLLGVGLGGLMFCVIGETVVAFIGEAVVRGKTTIHVRGKVLTMAVVRGFFPRCCPRGRKESFCQEIEVVVKTKENRN